MITVTAIFTGSESNLRAFAFAGIKYAQSKKISKNTLEVKWICESSNSSDAIAETLDEISQREMHFNNIELISIS